MKIDNPEHQKFLLELIASASYPGAMIELVYEVHQAVKTAEVLAETSPITAVSRSGA